MGPIVGWKDDGSELFVDHGSATMWNMEFMMKAERDSFKPGFLVVNLWESHISLTRVLRLRLFFSVWLMMALLWRTCSKNASIFDA